jgi:hypothetical protein
LRHPLEREERGELLHPRRQRAILEEHARRELQHQRDRGHDGRRRRSLAGTLEKAMPHSVHAACPTRTPRRTCPIDTRRRQVDFVESRRHDEQQDDGEHREQKHANTLPAK